MHHSDEYVLLRPTHVLPEFVMYYITTGSGSVDVPKTQMSSVDAMPSEQRNFARDILVMCSNLERELSGGVRVVDEGAEGDDALDSTRSKQALLAALGRIIELFTKMRISLVVQHLPATR